jgi:hypothetical protein
MERDLPTSLAMSLRATVVIQAAPNAIESTHRAAVAATHEALVSTVMAGV